MTEYELGVRLVGSEMFIRYIMIANPLLVNLLKGDYRPTAKSPSIDNGYDDGHYSFDLDGNPIMSKRDIGAYEFQGK